MKNKTILSSILMICFILSIFSTPVFGAAEDSQGLEQAIRIAKNIISVPESYTEFTNHSNERETSSGKIRIWRLNWAEKEGKGGFVSASVGDDGFLYEYRKYSGERNDSGLAKITKDKAQNLAKEFLEKARPNYVGEMRKVDTNSDRYSNEEYYFNYQRFYNDIPVNFINVSVRVNKNTGEVTYFNGGESETKVDEYQASEGLISIADAEKAYIEKIGMDLKYYSYYDYNQKKMNVFAGYSIDKNISKAIDGKTGQVVTLYQGDEVYDKKDNISEANLDKNVLNTSGELTKEEQEEVNNVANLITKEKAENIIRERFDIINSDIKFKDASLNKSTISGKYRWNISFEGAYGEVDASTGEIIALHYYKEDNSKTTKITDVDGKSMAENFLKKIQPNKFTQTKYKENKEPLLKIESDNEDEISSFNFVRQVNGIEFSKNFLSVEVNKTNGKIVGYDNEWYDDISFPDISKAICKEAAFNNIKKLLDFKLQYTKLDKNKIGLVYNFKNMNESYIIDPISGERLDFTGKAYTENKLPEYKDIAGHWCEKTVKELLDNGYYIDGDTFNPDITITQVKFLKYLYSPRKNEYNTDDEFYNMLIKNGVIKNDEKAPNSFVTNGEAAKFIVRNLGYDKIAMQSEIFNNPFKDNIEEKNKGYAAICYSLNIIKGVNGNFNENHNISNAEASIIIYNTIKAANK